jgi:hypothetical protein
MFCVDRGSHRWILATVAMAALRQVQVRILTPHTTVDLVPLLLIGRRSVKNFATLIKRLTRMFITTIMHTRPLLLLLLSLEKTLLTMGQAPLV